MELDYGLVIFDKYRDFEPRALTTDDTDVVAEEWYTHGYYGFAPHELRMSRHYEVPRLFLERPAGLDRYDYAAKDAQGRVIYTQTIEEGAPSRYSRSYIHERNTICILNHDMERKHLLGLSYTEYTEDGVPECAVAVFSKGAASKRYQYTHRQGRCETIQVSSKTRDGLNSYVYRFVFGSGDTLLKVLLDEDDVIYVTPTKLLPENLLKKLRTGYLKEAKAFIADNNSRPEPFQALAVYYGPERPFSTVSFSLLTDEEAASKKRAGAIEDTWETWDPQELESLEDFEPVDSKNREHVALLAQLWKPNDEELNREMSDFSGRLLKSLKKTYKSLKYAYACDYECRFLKENLKNAGL